ncbi:MAG: sensor histidine kinase [Eubacteriales bacterium]|nr:sensor histidine kinase [Eubacteriales bacterium]
MKRWERLRYLSTRSIIMHVVLCGLLLFSAVTYVVFGLPNGAPVWPLIVVLLGTGCSVALLVWFVMRPYVRLEHLLDLFIDGYTLSVINDGKRQRLTPNSERLIQKMEEDFNTSHLLVLSKRQAQYQALQNQINPHFLYNTLESIRSEALIAGLNSVAEMTEALATFFRYTITKVENLVSVEEELQNCETYFRIQQYRFGSKLQLHIECDPEEREEIFRCRLPKLTLQPILENGIIHGTEFKVGAGNLRVRLERTGKRLLIEVSDDGIGMDEETLARVNERLGKSGRAFQDNGEGQRGGMALVNVHNRIHLLFGEEYGLHVYSLPGVGTDVQISLPIITSDRNLQNIELL